jgi:hypothetical protein
VLSLLVLLSVAVPVLVRAQSDSGETPIFRRFTSPPERSETRLRLFEVPLRLRPQTDPQAKVTQDQGFGYTVAALPFNRVFASVGVNFARVRWTPTEPGFSSSEVRTLDVHQDLDFWLWRRLVLSLGLGLGIMDGLVVKADGGFQHNLIPYIPVRIGLDVVLWQEVFVGLRVVAVPFFGQDNQDYEIGHSQLLLSAGWAY